MWNSRNVYVTCGRTPLVNDREILREPVNVTGIVVCLWRIKWHFRNVYVTDWLMFETTSWLSAHTITQIVMATMSVHSPSSEMTTITPYGKK